MTNVLSDEAGSSPRMRGTPLRETADIDAPGIIPAYAGNTPPCPGRAAIHWDHPRVCGEHCSTSSAVFLRSGSSPRMRGTPQQLALFHCCSGIIPAYAGNTGSAQTFERRSWDHPRVCGEHWSRSPVASRSAGSSPRMRGTPHIFFIDIVSMGIIPAYAGNTRIVLFRFRKIWDHPRVCGEHKGRSGIQGRHRGSSPRMRGTRHA